MSAHIKPWRETAEAATITASWDAIRLADAEIAELRAALAIAQNVIGVLRHYPDFDDGNNAYSVMMDQVLAGETPALLTSLDALAAGRKPPAAPLPQQAAGDAQSKCYCIGGCAMAMIGKTCPQQAIQIGKHEQEEFEAWAKEYGADIRSTESITSSDAYKDPETDNLWTGWKARAHKAI